MSEKTFIETVKLNDMQEAAVYKTEGPLLVLAGAGSGKTRVLTHRIAYLIKDKGVMPYNIMAITFTNKAASEMRERVDKIVGSGADQIWVSTFHSACVRILRRFITEIGYSRDFVIYDADDQKRVIKNIIKQMNLDPKMFKEKGIAAKISDFKNKLMRASDVREQAEFDFKKKVVADIYTEYQRVLKQNNALDFDDLIMKTVELFAKNPIILAYYHDQIKYLMVDEYQDTNMAQFKLIRQLASGSNNICVVGDDDQSIYKFRGADIRNILEFEKQFPGTTVIKLEQNYRSTKTILEAANAVIHNNVGRKDKTLWCDNEEGKKIDVYQANDAYDEASMIAGEIQDKVDNGQADYNDFALLYRTNAQSRALEEKLMMKNIPYKIIGGQNFYQRREIKDILAYLRIIANSTDDLAVERVVNVPKRGIGQTTVGKAVDYARANSMNLYDVLLDASNVSELSRASAKIRSFTDIIEKLRTQLAQISTNEDITLKTIVDELLELTGYIRELHAEETDEAEARVENISELITKIAEYEKEHEEPNLAEFLEEVSLVSDIDTMDEDSSYVVLMTVHSAKGLEFPYVFLCGMEDGLFPGYMSIMAEEPDELEEERRLAYVAITRAMKHLTISYAKQRMIRGEVNYNMVSRFVKEIPRNIVSSKNVTSTLAAGRGQGAYGTNNYGSVPTKRYTSGGTSSYTSKPKNTFGTGKKPTFGKQFTVTKADIDYTVGDRVSHIKFGQGTVKNIENGPRDYQVTVEFDDFGQKMMMASFAKLKKL